MNTMSAREFRGTCIEAKFDQIEMKRWINGLGITLSFQPIYGGKERIISLDLADIEKLSGLLLKVIAADEAGGWRPPAETPCGASGNPAAPHRRGYHD